jgi:hypothetical protein
LVAPQPVLRSRNRVSIGHSQAIDLGAVFSFPPFRGRKNCAIVATPIGEVWGNFDRARGKRRCYAKGVRSRSVSLVARNGLLGGRRD